MRAICIFCGSNVGRSERYAEAARALVRAMARQRLNIVYGGGSIGLMGVIAEAALAAGLQVTGVAPQRLIEREVVHRGLSALHVVDSMHERKAKMADLADAFIAMPGGYGTLDELFEALTWTQLGYHRKASGLLNVAGYFDGLIRFLDHAVQEGFLTEEHRGAIIMETDPRRLLEHMQASTPPDSEKLMGRTHR